MGKINQVLRWIFIFFNGMFALFGCLLIIGALKVTAYSQEVSSFGGPNLVWTWVFPISVLGIACLGIYAAYSEKILPLKIFAGFMTGGMILMFILGFVMVVSRNKMMDALQSVSSEVVDYMMQDETIKMGLEELQIMGHCCGLKRANDWGYKIPSSCACSHEEDPMEAFGLSRFGCQSKPLGSSGPDQIYSRPCWEVILTLLGFMFQVFIGLLFGLGAIAFLGLLISLLMLQQVKRRDAVGGASMTMKTY